MNKIDFTTLNNGLIFGHDQMPGIETVAISVLVKTGSRDEEHEQSGISHFLEHMAFKGTTTRTAKEIAEEFDKIGGYFNAYTSREKTVYYAKVLKNDMQLALDILSDILLNSTLAVEEIEKERKVILQEMAQTKDTPDDIIFDYFQATAFPNQALGRAILGEEAVIKHMHQKQLQNYIQQRYGVNNMIITAAGNLDIELYESLINQKFAHLNSITQTKPTISNYVGGEFKLEKDLEQVHLVLGFAGVSYLSDDYYTQQALSIIAGGGMSSRLFQEVRENRGLAYTISAYGSSYVDNGIFGIYSASSEDTINELIDTIINELQKMTYTITEQEVSIAKAQVKAHLLMSRESSIARAEKLGSNLANHKRYLSISEIMEKINAIQPHDIESYLKNIMLNQQITISSIGKINNIYQYDVIKQKLKL